MFYHRGESGLFPFNAVLFTQELPNEMILLYMDYYMALGLEKTDSWKKQVIWIRSLEVLAFPVPAFKEIQNLYNSLEKLSLTFNHSAPNRMNLLLFIFSISAKVTSE